MCGVLDGDDVAVPSVEQIVATMAQQFQTLPLASSGITHQPDGDWAMVNIDFIVMTDPSPQILTTTLLGVDVAVRATPVHYSWDFGDGSPAATTSDPGQPYPGQTVTHVYSSASDAVAVTLTTQWRGELQIGGQGPWLPIAGYATTTDTTAPIEIAAFDVVLVPEPVSTP